jgi:ABC-type nitrate/sulfonate/bicarbonate transport system substrate-binding protein
MRRLIALGLLCALTTLAFPALAADKVRLPYSPIGWESLPWYIGKDGGYYEKYGIDAEIFFQGASSPAMRSSPVSAGRRSSPTSSPAATSSKSPRW